MTTAIVTQKTAILTALANSSGRVVTILLVAGMHSESRTGAFGAEYDSDDNGYQLACVVLDAARGGR